MAGTAHIPADHTSVTPSLTVHGAAEAIAFYKQAFDAVEITRALAPDGRSVWHAEIQVGNARVMLNDEFPEMGGVGPLKLGGTPVSFFLYVEDADAVFQQAVSVGATVVMPMQNMFWGDRCGMVADPYGHRWNIATRVEEVSFEEAQRRGEAFATANA